MRLSIHKKAANSIAWLAIQISSIFLAIVVVGYLVDFISSTQEKGMNIPKETLGMAKTGFAVKDVTGFSVDSNTSNYEGLIITVKPLAGSEAINLEKSTIYIQVGNRTARLHIINASTRRNPITGFYTE